MSIKNIMGHAILHFGGGGLPFDKIIICRVSDNFSRSQRLSCSIDFSSCIGYNLLELILCGLGLHRMSNFWICYVKLYFWILYIVIVLICCKIAYTLSLGYPLPQFKPLEQNIISNLFVWNLAVPKLKWI